MELSIAGVVVSAAVLLLGLVLGSPIIIGLFASLAFGATAIATLSSLGGASPLIYTIFAFLLIMLAATRRSILHDFGSVLTRFHTAWLICWLSAYAIASAVLFPRMFAGQTSAFVPSRLHGVMEVSLAPVSSNVTQTGYFLIHALAFFAICMILIRAEILHTIRRAFFVWCIFQATFGLVDIIGKLIGLGDVLFPIRTASYAMLTDATEAGFVRISGAYSEASAFGGTTLACLAFVFTYWRRTGSSSALVLWLILLGLLALSTSSTAYLGIMIIVIPVVFSVAASALLGRMSRDGLWLIAIFLPSIAFVLAIHLYDAKLLDPFFSLVDTTLLNKSTSISGQERSYWNEKSLQSIVDTFGLGVGFGSSRPSSWLVAVISQLGVIGTLMMAGLVASLWQRVKLSQSEMVDHETLAIHDSARACGLASLVGAAIAGTTPDPGLVFFLALGTVLACRYHLQQQAAYARGHVEDRLRSKSNKISASPSISRPMAMES